MGPRQTFGDLTTTALRVCKPLVRGYTPHNGTAERTTHMSRRLNHEGTITKKNGRDLYQGQIRVTLDDGTRGRRTAYAKTRKGVQQKLRAIRLQQEQGILTLARDESMREYLLRWYKNPDLRPNTIHSRYININRILPHIGGIKLKDLKANHIKDVYERLSERLSHNSVVQAHGVLRKALKDAVKEGAISKSPIDRLVYAPTPKAREMDCLTEEEISRLLGIDDEWQPFWSFQIGTGLRLGEALGLSWDNVDMDRRRVMVRRSLQAVKGQGLLYQPPKTIKSRRTVVLPIPVVDGLSAHRSRQAEQRLQLGPDWEGENLVFPNEWGKPMHPTRVNRALNRSIKAAGITRHIRVHDLRHTAASLALRNGIHPKVVQEMLGHSTIAITLDIYSHLMPTMQEEAADKMGEFLRAG